MKTPRKLHNTLSYNVPQQLLLKYQARVRSGTEYCYHLWDGFACYHEMTLDSVEHKENILISDDSLVKLQLLGLDQRLKVAFLSVFYRPHFGKFAQELHKIVPPSPFFRHHPVKQSEILHLFNVNIPHVRTNSFPS